MNLPKFLRPEPSRRCTYENVTVRQMKVPSQRALNNFALLTATGTAEGVDPQILESLLMKIATGEAIKSRLEPKSTPGKFRTLWIPQLETYKYLLTRLTKVIGSFSTSPEAMAFRKDTSALKGLRGMLDEYEAGCKKENLPEKKTAHNEGHTIGTCYQGDIQDYYGTITYKQVEQFLEKRFAVLLKRTLSPEEIVELVSLITDVVCPGEVLPQGFSTSPAIANGVGAKLDRGIRRGVRAVLGDGNVSVVGRYADDLVVMTSCGFHEKVLQVMGDVLQREGFKLHPQKVHVTRAREEGRSSRIRALGIEIRNDGDGPLGFSPVASYVHEVRDALQFVLSCDMKDQQVCEKVLDRKGFLARATGGVGYIRDILYWGMPHGAPLRREQEFLLPREIEELWKQVRDRFKDMGKLPDFGIGKKLKMKQDKKPSLSRHAETLKIFGWGYETFEDTENGNGFAITKQGAEGKADLMRVNHASLEQEGLPENPEEIEQFLMTVEESLRGKIEALWDKYDKVKGKKKKERLGEANLQILSQEFTPIKEKLDEILLEFLEWNLCARLNVCGLSAEDFGNFVDMDISDTEEKRSSIKNPMFPWGLDSLWEEFSKQYRERFPKSQYIAHVFAISQLHEATRPSRPAEYLYNVTDRDARRTSKGTYLHLREFKLKAANGVPFKS